MTSKIIWNDSSKKKYPQMMIDQKKESIVLFIEESVGVVVWIKKGYTGHKIGYFGRSWVMYYFSEWHGTISLTEE